MARVQDGGKVGGMKLELGVAVYDECCTGPTRAIVEINEALIEEILRRMAVVRALNVYCIETFDYSATYVDEDGEEDSDDWRLDYQSILVTRNSIRWTAKIKNTDVDVKTEEVFDKQLLEGKELDFTKNAEDVCREILGKVHDEELAIEMKMVELGG